MSLGGSSDLGDVGGLNALIAQSQIDEQNKGKGKKDRGLNWSVQEDVSLAKAWIAISEDGITSTDQSMGTFWERCLAMHNENFRHIGRDNKKLLNRWSTLNGYFSKWASSLEVLEASRGSEMTDENIYEQAKILFNTRVKKEWKWQPAYDIVKDNRKWRKLFMKNEVHPRSNRSGSKHSSDGEVRTPGSASSTPMEVETKVELERPVGKKALKEKRKKEKEAATQGFSEASSTIKELVVQLDKRFVRREELDKENLQMRKEIEMKKLEMKHQLEMKKLEFKEKALDRQHQDFARIEEQKILSMSVDSVPKQYREAFKVKQAALAAKWATSWETPDFGYGSRPGSGHASNADDMSSNSDGD